MNADEPDGPELRLQEADFFAADTQVTIVPSVSVPATTFIQGHYGPFEPSLPVDVPLWLAIEMKKMRKCKIHTPPWMGLKELQRTVERERSSPLFAPVPFYYAEIAALLLHHAKDDMRSPAAVRRSVEDLTSARNTKLRRFVQGNIRGKTHGVKLQNIASIELNNYRPMLAEVLETFYRLDAPATARRENTSQSNAQTAASSQPTTQPRTLRRFQT